MSRARDARLLLIGALLAVVSTGVGFAVMIVFAPAAFGHSCVGEWRVEQWQSAVGDSASVVEIARPELVGLPICVPAPPAPPPTTTGDVPVAVPVPSGEITGVIVAAFTGHPHVSPQQALDIAWCESRHEPSAKNPVSSAGGLFQFLTGTWRREAEHFGFPTDPVNRFDPHLAAELAALVMARDGGPRQWLCKG